MQKSDDGSNAADYYYAIDNKALQKSNCDRNACYQWGNLYRNSGKKFCLKPKELRDQEQQLCPNSFVTDATPMLRATASFSSLFPDRQKNLAKLCQQITVGTELICNRQVIDGGEVFARLQSKISYRSQPNP